jgi:hypothetical protein
MGVLGGLTSSYRATKMDDQLGEYCLSNNELRSESSQMLVVGPISFLPSCKRGSLRAGAHTNAVLLYRGGSANGDRCSSCTPDSRLTIYLEAAKVKL